MCASTPSLLLGWYRDRGLELTLVKGGAESLPIADSSFDAVVSTLVLCSVADPAQVLREVHRVLRPGGRYCFIEHVRGLAGEWGLRTCGPAPSLTP